MSRSARRRWCAVLLVGGCLLGLGPARVEAGETVRASLAAVDRPEPAGASEEEVDLATVRSLEGDLVERIARARRSTVSLLNRRRSGDEGGDRGPLVLSSVGSGVVIRYRGSWIVTNVHVIQDAESVEAVTHDGRRHRVRVHRSRPDYDLALLAFEKMPEGVEAVPLPRCCRPGLEPGTLVLATGNPFFLANDGTSVPTMGIVSGRTRWIEAEMLHGSTVQHDAAVNPGNSGGPLWDVRGRLVGINETIATHSRSQGSGPCSTGASFAIAGGQVRRAVLEMLDPPAEAPADWQGLVFATARDAKGRPAGAEALDDGGSVALSLRGLGLEGGDVVTAVSADAGSGDASKSPPRRVVRTAGDLARWLETSRPGASVRIEYRRGRDRGTWSGALPKP